MSFVSPSQLKEKILEHKELALVDVRSEGAFAGAHLLYAISIPLAVFWYRAIQCCPGSPASLLLIINDWPD